MKIRMKLVGLVLGSVMLVSCGVRDKVAEDIRVRADIAVESAIERGLDLAMFEIEGSLIEAGLGIEEAEVLSKLGRELLVVIVEGTREGKGIDEILREDLVVEGVGNIVGSSVLEGYDSEQLVGIMQVFSPLMDGGEGEFMSNLTGAVGELGSLEVEELENMDNIDELLGKYFSETEEVEE